VFVTRRDRSPISAFADLSRVMTLGVQLVGESKSGRVLLPTDET
jgi:hypothetical protein